MTADDRGSRHLLRHAVATLADRGGKVVRDIPENFETLRVSPTSRTPSQILAHVGDLLDWALWMARGQRRWRDSEPLPWDLEVARFFGALERLDTVLGSEAALGLLGGATVPGTNR